MYSLKIGLGGTGSNAGEPVKPNSAISSGVHHPSTAPTLTAVPPITTAPLAALSSPSASVSSASSLLARLASPSPHSHSPFASSFFDAALSHVIPVAINARPVPLTTAENAAEGKRQERKHKKAERRKAEKENSQPPVPAEAEEQAKVEDTAVTAAAADEHSHTNGHSSGAAGRVEPTGNGAAQQETGRAAGGRKPRKAKESKRPLNESDQLTLTVAQLKAIVAAAGEKVVRECCKQMTNLSVKQRKEVQESLIKEHAAAQSSTLHQTLYDSSAVQAALRQKEESEQAGTTGAETTETAAGTAEGTITTA